MKKITLLFFIVACYGQILPTVPANMFRITLDNYSMTGELNLKGQEFNMRGVGRSYFDDITRNDSGFYIGAYDLSKSLNIDPTGSEMKKIIKDVTQILKKNNINVGAIVFNKEDFKELTNYGVNFIVYSVDSKIIASGIDTFISNIEI